MAYSELIKNFEKIEASSICVGKPNRITAQLASAAAVRPYNQCCDSDGPP